ncbi:hypothetical protein [Zavarzinella formosa]|uniref:hypothetical protein n=1 Tax=Zavarzinella formosa TaxID=360055 RepID=UPI0002F3075E|nr:hypothetical protein [Zavarzinella formosa]
MYSIVLVAAMAGTPAVPASHFCCPKPVVVYSCGGGCVGSHGLCGGLGLRDKLHACLDKLCHKPAPCPEPCAPVVAAPVCDVCPPATIVTAPPVVQPVPMPVPMPKPEVKPVPMPMPVPMPKPEVKPVPKVEAKPEVKPEVKPVPKVEVKPVPKVEAKPNLGPTPDVKPAVKDDSKR